MIGHLFTAAGYLAGAIVFIKSARGKTFSRMQTAWLATAGLAGGILGAKLVRLAFATAGGAHPLATAAHPDGRTIVGGILGGWLAVELCKMGLKIKRSTGDCFALAVPLGEAIGRIGCFLNGCCYGAPSQVPWVVFQHDQWRHPAQIYSIFTNLAIFAFLYFMRKRTARDGDLFRLYLILWASSRFCLEFVRQRTDIYYGLSLAQWVCLEVAVSVSLAMLVADRFLRKRAAGTDDSLLGEGV